MRTQANRPRHRLATLAAVLLSSAALWDIAGALSSTPQWWSAVSHATAAAGTATGCVAVLIRLFDRRARPRRARRTALQLGALGLMLLAWLLRGHPAIPPDPPLTAAEAAAAALYLRAIRRARDVTVADGVQTVRTKFG